MCQPMIMHLVGAAAVAMVLTGSATAAEQAEWLSLGMRTAWISHRAAIPAYVSLRAASVVRLLRPMRK